MRTFNFFSIIILSLCFSGAVFSQDIDLRLGTNDSLSTLRVYNSDNNVVQSVTANGIFNFGYYKLGDENLYGNFNFGNDGTLNGFFNVGSKEFSFGDQDVDINLYGKSTYNTDGGSINIVGGDRMVVPSSGQGGKILVNGGKKEGGNGVGGNVDIAGGYGEIRGGDVDINGGQATDGSGGNIILKSGRGAEAYSSGDILLQCNEEGSYMIGGNIYINAGRGNDGGNVEISAGLNNGGSDGLVKILGSGTYTGTWSNVSDRRFKKDIAPLPSLLQSVLKLNPVNYYWKKNEFPDRHFSSSKQTGLIAQEVKEHFPELVMEDKDGYLSVDYVKLSVLLLKSIQEQQEIIEKQEQTIGRQMQIAKEQSDQIKAIAERVNRLSENMPEIVTAKLTQK